MAGDEVGDGLAGDDGAGEIDVVTGMTSFSSILPADKAIRDIGGKGYAFGWMLRARAGATCDVLGRRPKRLKKLALQAQPRGVSGKVVRRGYGSRGTHRSATPGYSNPGEGLGSLGWPGLDTQPDQAGRTRRDQKCLLNRTLNPQVGDANPPGRTVEVRERQGRIARTESELAQMSWPTTRRHTAGGSKDGAAPSKTWVGRRRADASLPSASDRPGPGSATRRVPQVGEDRDQQVAVGEPARRAGTGARSGQRSRRPRRATTHRPPRDSATGRPGGNLGRAHQHPHVVQDLSDRERKVGGNPPCQLGVPRQLDLVQLALGG